MFFSLQESSFLLCSESLHCAYQFIKSRTLFETKNSLQNAFPEYKPIKKVFWLIVLKRLLILQGSNHLLQKCYFKYLVMRTLKSYEAKLASCVTFDFTVAVALECPRHSTALSKPIKKLLSFYSRSFVFNKKNCHVCFIHALFFEEWRS